MKRISRNLTLLSLAAFGLLQSVGCGGSSGGATAGLNTVGSRARVAAVLKSTAASSVEVKTQATSGLANRSINRIANRPARAQSTLTRGDGDSTGGGEVQVGSVIDLGDGNFGRITAYEQGGLDVLNQATVYNYDIFFGSDLRQQVGTSTSTATRTGDEFRNVSRTEFTSGAMAGTFTSTDFTFSTVEGGRLVLLAENRMRETFEGTVYTNTYRKRFERAAGANVYTFDYESNVNGVARTSRGTYFEDGRLELIWTGANGYTVTWNVAVDGSGTFSIANTSDPLMPATGTFNVDGIGTITFADNTTAAFDINSNQFWK